MKGTTLAPRREQREMTVTQRRPYPHTAMEEGSQPHPGQGQGPTPQGMAATIGGRQVVVVGEGAVRRGLVDRY